MPAQFIDLPDEIVSKIVNDVCSTIQTLHLHIDLAFFLKKFFSMLWLADREFLRSLRLVSKRLNNLIEPIVFEEILISPCHRPVRRTCEAITTELTTGKTTVFGRATRKAKIQFDDYAGAEKQKPWLDVVRLLTPTLENLHSVQYVQCQLI